VFANQHVGWVFLGYPDERLRSWLRPGRVHLFEDARAIAKEEGAPVLFLQLGARSAHWVGAGTVAGLEERWKMFGVHVRCTRVLSPGLPSVPPARPASEGGGPATDLFRVPWENRALASHLGLDGFRSTTPYLDDRRDLRLTAYDLRRLVDLQPGLRALVPP